MATISAIVTAVSPLLSRGTLHTDIGGSSNSLVARSTVLTLVIPFSRGNEAGRMIARDANTHSRIGLRSFSAFGAPGSLSVLVLTTRAGKAEGVAKHVYVEPLCALSAGGAASRFQLEAPNRAVGARCLSGRRGGFSGRAIDAAGRRSGSLRVGRRASGAVDT